MNLDFQSFLKQYKQKLHEVFTASSEADENTLVRGIEDSTLNEIMDISPLSAFIPEEYGGFGAHTPEALAMLEASSYESLPLSLMMGINGALFLQPVANYGEESVKKEIFGRVIKKNKLGGLMITEPDYGSDALRMQTSYEKDGDTYKIEGVKHWGGLTGMADYWLITARGMNEKGDLERDISFFIHDSRNGGIEVEEYYNNLGLYMLPYGKNRINIEVDKSHKLEPESTGVTMMLDLLHRSRLQFPGMGIGFLRRMMDEAVTHCKQRFVGGQSLFNYDQVKHRLSEIQAYFTICSAMCNFTGSKVPLDKNTSRMDIEANAIKSVVTDFMQKASQSLLQLTGAMGYRLDHIAGRSVVDSRPFQIFEGSNDILYQQITESVLKKMRRLKSKNLKEFLSEFTLTKRSSEYFKDTFNFEVDPKMPQRKLVDLGKVLGRMISMEFTLSLQDQGFNKELVQNALKTMEDEISSIMANYMHGGDADVVEDYERESNWYKFALMDA
ncbi:acyl-CoA dehydrogenase family protein [Gracilimonas mengyeensis]|uniref:Acyl-CoA dehydrogenase n=1 Tax=Gracilimonas mengyeensis TaxID=1302730 RepID=A0A521B4D7_9BACT|nr:acyl-CoA dehydrogenase [Gracilimonas mengyeensis]SMO41949.1 Acyl-CoA dehydrogenase [Gracilimonas mengyeensis]